MIWGRHRAIRLGVAAAVLAAAGGSSPVLAADAPARAQQSLQDGARDYATGDVESAWFRFWTLARQGDAAAQFNLAQFYRAGKGVPADLQLARYWYAQAAAQGHAYAQYNLGIMYERGDGVTRDLTEARAWYRRAAAQSIAGAQKALQRLEHPAALDNRRAPR